MIIPAILSDSLETIQAQIDRVKDESNLERVQIDIIDPDFTDNITVSPIDLLEIDLKGLKVDIHLMTVEPINDVIECQQIKGIHAIIAQVEKMGSQMDFVEHVRSYVIQAGLSLDLYTPVEAIEEYVFPKLSVVQVMGNKAGHQQEKFAGEPVLQKIRELASLRKQKNYTFSLTVDIGIVPETAQMCLQAGADELSSGSYLWNSTNIQSAVSQLLGSS